VPAGPRRLKTRARLAGALIAVLAVAVALIVANTGGRHREGRPRRPTTGRAGGNPTTTSTSAPVTRAAEPSRAAAERSLGELVIARYPGTEPPRRLLQRVRAGQVGGVILFAANTSGGGASTHEAIAALQREARAAADYPLLVMTDQEGGEVKRIASIPPALAPSETSSARQARREGLATGDALRSIGINVDLAPVADVEHDPDSFLGTRSYGSPMASPKRVSPTRSSTSPDSAMPLRAPTTRRSRSPCRALRSGATTPLTVAADAARARW
jgi:hypothetical protein